MVWYIMEVYLYRRDRTESFLRFSGFYIQLSQKSHSMILEADIFSVKIVDIIQILNFKNIPIMGYTVP